MSMSRGGGGGVTPSVEHLRRVADLALRQVKKLRKYELEQASPLISWLGWLVVDWLVDRLIDC